MPIQLKPVKMKNTLYLLVPKGISELLELDETRECTLTTETKGGNPALRYTFSDKEGKVGGPGEGASRVRTVSKQVKPVPT